MNALPEPASSSRTEQKRRAILAEATTLFLRNGYRGTSMDEVASAAAVSKQTVYKQFTDKEGLFREIIAGVAQNADAIVETIRSAFGAVRAATREELETGLASVARAYLDAVLEPQVLSLRRLIIAEAEQFPDLAESYFRAAPSRGIDTTAACLAPYVESGILVVTDVQLAAAHFAYLALAVAQDRALFLPSRLPGAKERKRLATAAARAFIAAYAA
ncbi:TetR/AcrR family transcriptional regulator [Gryllotalpicola reticulitermitis]|uniref:TetR/AcrR family transcriptional regulator n=1 Tax=Gryllotalpicola reticulitermitis TaxID=1184153 RepID=A0ABV8Q103_9MICO